MQSNKPTPSILFSLIGYLISSFTPVVASSFNYDSGTTITASQTLNPNETGTINDGATVTTDNASNGSIVINANATLTNSGTIKATSNTATDAVGVYVGTETNNNSNNTIINSGVISATHSGSEQSIGVHLRNGANNTIKNSGNITTSQSGTGTGMGIYLQYSNNSTVENSGSITNSSSSTAVNYGMLITGSSHSSITNSGIIDITASATSTGLRVTDSTTNTNIQNSGSIKLHSSTTSTNHTGIRVDTNSSSITITNSGTLSLSGSTGNTGIKFDNADNSIVNNSGTISAPQAILFDSDSDSTTLNLLSGSRIIGSIQLQGSDDTVNIKDSVYSSDLYIEGAEKINTTDAAVQFNDGSGNTRVVTLGSTNEISRSIALADFTSSVHSTVTQRLTRPSQPEPVQLASLTLSPSVFIQEQPPVFWSQFFGGTRDNNSHFNNYEQRHYGLNIGYEQNYESKRIGILGGISNATVDTVSSEGKTASYYTGLYAQHYFDQFNITASLLGGVGNHDNKRSVINSSAGTETAKSSFASVFLSPSITISSAFNISSLPSFEFRPSASLDYSLSYLPSYKESGTNNSNFKISSRTVTALSGKAEFAAAYQTSPSLEINAKVGFTLLEANEASIKATLNGKNLHLDSSDESSGTGSFVGIGMQTPLYDQLDFNAELVFGRFGKDENYINGAVNIEYEF